MRYTDGAQLGSMLYPFSILYTQRKPDLLAHSSYACAFLPTSMACVFYRHASRTSSRHQNAADCHERIQSSSTSPFDNGSNFD